MTNYPQLQEHLNRLNELLNEIQDEDMEIVNAKYFNKSNTFPELAIKLPKLRKELKALKTEYNKLLTKIKIL